MSFAIFGIPYKENTKKILLFSLLYGAVTFISSILLTAEVRLITNISSFLILSFFIFKHTLLRSFFLTIVAYASLLGFEVCISTVLLNLLDLDFKIILNDPKIRLLMAYTNLIPMIIATLIIRRLGWNIKLVETNRRTKYIIALVIISLLQFVLIFTFYVSLTVYKTYDHIKILGFPIHFILIVVLIFVSFFLLKQMYQSEIVKAVEFTETTHFEQFNSLMTSIRSERHDINNHLTVIHGLIKTKNIDHAEKYIHTLVKDVHLNNVSLQIKNPILSSLIFSKLSLAQTKGVELKLAINSEEVFTRFTSTDLIRLFSNLLDNAIEATMELPKEERKISLAVTQQGNHHAIIVENSSTLFEFSPNMLKPGISSKSSKDNHHKGFGLSIIQEIVKQYDGDFHLDVKNGHVSIHITFKGR